MATNYRLLTPAEIAQLEKQLCVADSWENIQVSENFTPTHIHYTRFSGTIRLGVFEKEFQLPGGMSKHAGLCRVTLHNVTVGDNCCIENVKNYIANYTIGHDTFIENVDIILVDRETSFGNGVEVSVLNETGGREVMIHDRLSAHEAYIMALYRHRPQLIERMKEIVQAYVKERTSDSGQIGNHVTIVDAGYIKNVFVGDYCQIEGTSRLKNGSINSNEHDPIHVGSGVICDDFIISSGSNVEDGTMLSRCFVGQACHMGHNYSASDSLFFSNCQEENGEACAIFAGPFTVTHHKSTLLIAGMFSFMNAGSGSNQSNHMYKLGPIHQGALERGAKTTSDSYILWPARIGAFSLVMGRHVKHPDTSNLPFSYLIEEKNTTYLAPGVNLRSVGTIRDAQKWPKRDKRKDPDRLDQINYNLLSPYTIQKMMTGRMILKDLSKVSGETSEILENLHFASDEEIRARLQPDTPVGGGEWVDVSGLIAPKSEVERLMQEIETGSLTTVAEMHAQFAEMHRNYYTYEWTWAYEKMLEFYQLDATRITAKDIVAIVKQWQQSVVELDKMVYEDARKEFSLSSMTGFGADGTRREQELDFEQVRGAFESNPFVTAVLEHIRVKTELGNELIARLDNLL